MPKSKLANAEFDRVSARRLDRLARQVKTEPNEAVSTESLRANGHTTLNAPGLVGSPKSKQRRVSLVPGWVTAWEYEMLLATILLLLLLRAGFCLLTFADSCYCGAINERTAASPFFGLRRVDRRRTERRVAGNPAKVSLNRRREAAALLTVRHEGVHSTAVGLGAARAEAC